MGAYEYDGFPSPAVTTHSATYVTSTSATLNGEVNPRDASTAVVFEYGTSTSYGSSVIASQSPLTGTTSQAVSVDLTGLMPGSTYHFRAKATNNAGVTYGDDKTFTTTVDTPSSITVPSSDSDGSYTVSWGASSTSSVTYVLEEATNSSFSSGLRTAYSGSSTSTTITGRSSGATYYYRVKATRSGYNDSAWRTGSNGCTVLSLPACSQCSDDPVALLNVTFPSGTACECSATTSITIGTGVTIKNGATVIFKAPTVKLQSGFHAEEGSVVNIRQE